MSGNAMEEGLLMQIHNPSHTDPSRIGFLAGALSGFACIVVLSILVPTLARLLSVYFSVGVAAWVGTIVTQRITARRLAFEAACLQDARDMQQRESQRQIAVLAAQYAGANSP